MEKSNTTRKVISKGRKQKKHITTGRMCDTEMVIYKTQVGVNRYVSQTRHELK